MDRQSVIRVGRRVVAWIAALLLITIFVPQGWAKFSDTSGWAIAFRHWGYPVWFRMLIGAMELTGAALLLWESKATIGALIILVVMLGAWGTHLVFDQGRHMTSEIVPIVLSTLVLVLRREQVSGWRRQRIGSSRLGST